MLASALGVGSAAAHHTMPGRTHPTVTIQQPVMADGKTLPAGTYEITVTNERPDVGAGAPSDAQRVVEFTRNGQVVARVVAEVFPRAGREAVGTSGTAGSARARTEMLRGGEFLRVSFNDTDGRYLIHLLPGPLNEPAPQPQSPSRIEQVSPPTPAPAPNQPAAPPPQAPTDRP
jgi:hypothetical protein